MKNKSLKISMTLLCLFCITATHAQTIVWKELASLPEAYNGGEAVCLNNEIYFVAGRTKTTRSVASFYKFNPQKNQWTKLADIPKPATNFALAAVKGKIYAIGGDKFQNANREYNPETNSWKLLKPMPTARQHINCGIDDNKIFIAGGLTSWENITQKHEVYDVLSDSWSERAAIPSLRNNATVATLDSLMYVFGGAGTRDNIWGDVWTVETYNMHIDTWEQKNDLPQLLFGSGVTVVNNEIIVLGGQTRENSIEDATTKVFIYKAKFDQWIETTPLPIKNVFFGCTSVGNKIYVIGGTVGGNPNWDNYSTVYEGTIVNNTSGNTMISNEKLITGSWIGAIKMGDENPDLVFNLFADSTGAPAGNLSVPAKGVKELPLSSVTIEGRTVTLDIEAAQARFTGVLVSNGSALEGNWQEGENSYQLTLKSLTEKIDYAKQKHKNNSNLNLALTTAHFEFHSKEKDREALYDLAKELEKNYTEITRHMSTEFKDKIKVFIYPDLSAFHKAVNYPEAPDWVVGAAGKNELKMVSPLNPGKAHSYESLMQAIVHEFAHTVVLNIREHGAVGLPNWLNEGYACYEADQLTTAQRRAVQSGISQKTIPGWDEIREANTSQFGEMGGYEISATIIEFLVQAYGFDKLRQFIITPGSVEKIYGMSELELENMWGDYLIN